MRFVTTDLGMALRAGGAYMPLFGRCAISERPAGAGSVTGMAKAAGS